MSSRLRSFLFSPYVVMSCVVAMYALKVLAKVGIGSYINSPSVSGDGFHNINDIVEALVAVWLIKLACRPADEKYPFGRGNVEGIFKLAVGGGLVLMSGYVGLRSLNGLMEYVPSLKNAVGRHLPLPVHEPLLMGSQYFWWVTGLMAISIALSFTMSAYEIRAGRVNGHKILVADGEETRSDSMIEMTILAGVFGEYYFGAPWIEYFLGLGVAVLVFRTGKKMFFEGRDDLLQRSIGKEHEQAIRDIAMTTHGVVGVADLKTFQVGPLTVCIMKVVTRCSAKTDLDIKTAVAARLREYLESHGFEQVDYYIRFDRPKPERRRIAYAIRVSPASLVVADGLETATHVQVCDIEDGAIVRSKDVPAPSALAECLELLKDKHVAELRAFRERPAVIGQLERAGIGYADSAVLTMQFPGVVHACTSEVPDRTDDRKTAL